MVDKVDMEYIEDMTDIVDMEDIEDVKYIRQRWTCKRKGWTGKRW